MKILSVNNLHYVEGGSDRVYLETSKLLKKKGVEVIYFSTKNENNEAGENECFVSTPNFKSNVSIVDRIKNAFRFIYSRESAKKLEKLIESERPDLAHLHIIYGELTSSILPVFKKYNVPVVMSVHEYRMLCPISIMINKKGKTCEKCAKGNYLYCIFDKCKSEDYVLSAVVALEALFRDTMMPYQKYVDKFIMVSKFIDEIHCKYKQDMVGSTEQIYNFVSQRIETCQEKEDYYLFFGRLNAEKGINTVIDAFKKLESKLLIVGKGSLEESIKSKISEYNLDNIHMLGFKSGKELRSIISKAKYSIVPSEWYENNPMTVLESLTYGTPVIGSDIGGIPELIKNNVNGYIFKPGDVDGLIDIINKTKTLSIKKYNEQVSESKKMSIELYSEDAHYKKLINVYKDVIKSTGENK